MAGRSPTRIWTGILAGVMAIGVGVYISAFQIIVDSFAQALILGGLVLVSGGHLGSVILPVLRATKAGASAALGPGKDDEA